MHTAYEVNGLPAHPLLVHAVVVLLPLAALLTILHALWPAARARLGIMPTVLSAFATVLVPVTTAAGKALATQRGLAALPAVRHHEELADQILPWAIALTVVALGNWWWRRRSSLTPRWLSIAVPVVTVLVSAGVVAVLVRAADAGARATWG